MLGLSCAFAPSGVQPPASGKGRQGHGFHVTRRGRDHWCRPRWDRGRALPADPRYHRSCDPGPRQRLWRYLARQPLPRARRRHPVTVVPAVLRPQPRLEPVLRARTRDLRLPPRHRRQAGAAPSGQPRHRHHPRLPADHRRLPAWRGGPARSRTAVCCLPNWCTAWCRSGAGMC